MTMTERASIFGSEDLDLTEFAPVRKAPDRTDDIEAIRNVAIQKGFVSREGDRSTEGRAPAPQSSALPRRRYTTGRNRQLNMKVTDEALKRFYALADAQGWVLGETFEHAVAALERELSDS